MKRFLSILAVIIILLNVSPFETYAQQPQQQKEQQQFDVSLEAFLLKQIKSMNPRKDIRNLHIICTQNVDNLDYVFSSFLMNGKEFQSNCLIDKSSNGVPNISIGLVHTHYPVDYGGSTLQGSQHLFTGIVSDPSITKIKIYLNNKNFYILPLIDDRYFFVLLPPATLSRVQGLDKKNHVVFDDWGRK